MQTEAAGLDFVEAAATQLRGVDGGTLVTKQNFEAVSELRTARGYTGAIHFDGLIGPSVITMTNDVGQGFVNRAGDGAAIGRRKAEDLGEAFERATNDGE
jgi:hypothetical protein